MDRVGSRARAQVTPHGGRGVARDLGRDDLDRLGLHALHGALYRALHGALYRAWHGALHT